MLFHKLDEIISSVAWGLWGANAPDSNLLGASNTGKTIFLIELYLEKTRSLRSLQVSVLITIHIILKSFDHS